MAQQDVHVLASDIDNTLTGDEKALCELAEQLTSLRKEGKLFLVLSTGRRLDQVLDGLQNENLPEPDAVVSQVGTEIYLPPLNENSGNLKSWEEKLRKEFSREQALHYVQNVEGIEMQPEKFNTPLKVSCYLDKAPDPEKAVKQIRAAVDRDQAGCQVIWSSSRDLDLIPASAGKGKAIRFVLEHEQVASEQVIVAGDSGNDSSMFEEFGRGIVVGNAKPELKAIESEYGTDNAFYFASASYAAGVHEGLRHFGVC